MPFLHFEPPLMMFVRQNTRLEVNCTKFLWTVNNCSYFADLKKAKVITSESFRAAKTNQLCYVTLCMTSKTLELHMDGYYLPLDLIITLSCVKKNGTPIKSQTYTRCMNSIEKMISSMRLNKDNMRLYMEEDSLNFLVVIEELRETTSTEVVDETSLSSWQAYSNKLTPKVDAMYTNQELCDVTLVVGKRKEEKFHAHSVILGALSSQFLTMFSQNCLENKTRHVVDMRADRNVTPQVLKGFLDYAYGIKNMLQLKHIVKNLAVMARKYDIAEMQKACEYLICDTLTVNTVIPMLQFAAQHQLLILKKKTVHFAKQHIDAVKASPQFEELYENKELFIELL